MTEIGVEENFKTLRLLLEFFLTFNFRYPKLNFEDQSPYTLATFLPRILSIPMSRPINLKICSILCLRISFLIV